MKPVVRRSQANLEPMPHVQAPRSLPCLFLFCLAAIGFGVPTASQAQSAYADYPQSRVKTEPLQWRQLPDWMTVGVEERERPEGQTSYGYAQDGNRVYDLTRVLGSVELRPTPWATASLQFMDSHALGLPLHAVAANMRDVFDLRQGWLEFHHQFGAVPVKFISGRQELKFGSERIVGASDWTNISRTFDGFVARIGDRNRVDLFSTSVVTVHPTSLDKHGAGLTFHGAYGTLSTWVPHAKLSPYVMVRAVRGVTSLQGLKGNEVETTFGSECEGELPAHFSYLANGSLQRGSYANNSIHAGQTFGKLYYTAGELAWAPRLGLEIDYATGNSHRDPSRIATYDQQYPSNHNAFGNTDLFGFENIRQERLNLDLTPARNLTVLVQGGFLNLAQRGDTLYSGSGTATIKAQPEASPQT
jgi:hypothetical protein